MQGAHAALIDLSKSALHQLANSLLLGEEPSNVERCVQFVLADTQGLWHGRARAMICRRLKHCSLSLTHRTQLATCITERLVNGIFSEQFKDQLRLVMQLDFAKMLEVCGKNLDSPKPHVRRYAKWVLLHDANLKES